MIRIVDIEQERAFACKHAISAYKIYKDWMSTLPSFSVVMDGYRFDDENGISVFLDYEGKVRATVS